MPPEKRDPAYLFDMLNAAQWVVRYVNGKTFADYLDDGMLRSAVERQMEIIGEAARRVSESFKDAHAEIPWRKIVNQRHVLAHEYGEIENEKIWDVATKYVPEMIRLLTPLVPPLPPIR